MNEYLEAFGHWKGKEHILIELRSAEGFYNKDEGKAMADLLEEHINNEFNNPNRYSSPEVDFYYCYVGATTYVNLSVMVGMQLRLLWSIKRFAVNMGMEEMRMEETGKDGYCLVIVFSHPQQK